MNRIIIVLIFAMAGLTSNLKAQVYMNGNDQLNRKQQALVAISAFTAKGDQVNLKPALHEGLGAGLTVNEIKEVLVQLYAYCGFPRSLNAIDTFIAVMDERAAKGIRDTIGKEATPLSGDQSSLALGTAVQTYLIGAPAAGAAMEFAPAIDAFLKSHLFGDIFGRDNLDYQSREIATIAALSGMGGVESQLKSHFNIGLNIGLTEAQLQSLISVLAARVGTAEADTARSVLAARGKQKSATAGVAGRNRVFPKGKVIEGPNFTGAAWLQMLMTNESDFDCSIGNVTFEPGCRNNWHSHPGGQLLLVTSGQGYYQQEGRPVRLIRTGDVVEILPDVVHWHGATPDSGMEHIAISTRISLGPAVWGVPVTDGQYNNYSE